MFKRLADRVTNAVASVGSSRENSSSAANAAVETLTNLGFSPSQAQQALEANQNNVERAAEWLLTHGSPLSPSSQEHAAHATNAQQVEDAELQKALQASLAVTPPTNMAAAPPIVRSAASQRAGQAALARFEQQHRPKSKKSKSTSRTTRKSTSTVTTTATTAKKPTPTSSRPKTPPKSAPSTLPSHPKVQVPKRLQQHSLEEQLLRCARRVAPHAKAVDRLLLSLQQLQANPKHAKFQTIDTQSGAFGKHFGGAPGVVDFFQVMNYHKTPAKPQVLQLAYFDATAVYLGISALEQIQQDSAEYSCSKALILFQDTIQEAMDLGNKDTEEAIARSRFLSKCPSEPAQGGFVSVLLGMPLVNSHHHAMEESTSSMVSLQRKWDGDDTLQDVIHWLGSHASILPDKLATNEWCLINAHHATSKPYDLSLVQHKTLQYVGCWPSGQLQLVPYALWQQRHNLWHPNETNLKKAPQPTSSRGLGAGPMEE